MSNWRNTQTDALCDAFLTLQNRQECYDFLEDICTVRELLDISQRLTVARMLSNGTSYNVIRQTTGASTATISRVNQSYEHGRGGYTIVLSRQEEESDD